MTRPRSPPGSRSASTGRSRSGRPESADVRPAAPRQRSTSPPRRPAPRRSCSRPSGGLAGVDGLLDRPDGSLADASGSPVADVPELAIKTTAAPAVVRFRPTARHVERRRRTGAVGPVHAVDGPPQHEERLRRHGRRQAHRRHGLVRREGHRPRLPPDAAAAVRRRGRDARQGHGHGRPPACRSTPRPASGSGSSRSRRPRPRARRRSRSAALRRRLGRRRQLGRGRDVLPAA